MRNLKKFLALVLAMMMVFSLMLTASADTGAPDDAQISDKYREAVEVTTAVGVLKGDADTGNLNPTSPINRAQFAVILYRIATGDVDGKYAALNAMADYDQFTDVNAASYPWAAKYINYAANEGWLVGVGDNQYDPDSNVTYYQVLIALLRVLKLDDGISVDKWQFDTAVKAATLGLDANIGSIVGDASREAVAQMALNAMIYTNEIGYIYTVWLDADGNGAFDPGEKVLYLGPDYDQAMLFAQTTGAVVEREISTRGSLADKNFNGLRRLSGVGRDDFQRPTTVWVDDDYDVDTGAPIVAEFAHIPLATYNGNFTGKNAKALSANGKTVPAQGTGADNGVVDVYYNGGLADDNSTNSGTYGTSGTIDFAADNSPAAPGLWVDDNTAIPGYEVEVYTHVCAGANCTVKYDIIVREAYVAQVGTTASNGNITVNVYEVGKQATPGSDITAVAFPVKAATSSTPADAIYDDVAAFDKDEYIAVYMAPDWDNNNTDGSYILEVAPLVEESVNAKRIDDNKYGALSTMTTTTGVVYKVNNEALFVSTSTQNVARPIWDTSRGQTRSMAVGPIVLYTLNGNIMLWDQNSYSTPTTGYAYLYDFKDNSSDPSNKWESEGGSNPNNTGVWVRMLTSENEILEVELADDSKVITSADGGTDTPDGTTGQCANKIEKTDLGKLVWYSKNSNGKYTVELVDTTLDVGTAVLAKPGTAAGTDNVLQITNSKSEGVIPAGSDNNKAANVAFNSKTKFIVVTTETDAKTGITNWKKTANVYDIYNVPNISADSTTTYVTAAAVLGSGGSNGHAVTPANNPFPVASVVLIIDANTTTTADGYYFVLGTGSETETRIWVSGTDYYEYIEYPAVVDGVLTTVKVKVADTRTGAVSLGSSGVLSGAIKFVKNPTVDADDCIVAWGTNVEPGNVDANVIKTATGSGALSKVENDRIWLTNSDTSTAESYLVSKALSVAFAFNTTDGVLEPIELSDIVANENANYAIRNTAHTVVNVLFVGIDDAT